MYGSLSSDISQRLLVLWTVEYNMCLECTLPIYYSGTLIEIQYATVYLTKSRT